MNLNKVKLFNIVFKKWLKFINDNSLKFESGK